MPGPSSTARVHTTRGVARLAAFDLRDGLDAHPLLAGALVEVRPELRVRLLAGAVEVVEEARLYVTAGADDGFNLVNSSRKIGTRGPMDQYKSWGSAHRCPSANEDDKR